MRWFLTQYKIIYRLNSKFDITTMRRKITIPIYCREMEECIVKQLAINEDFAKRRDSFRGKIKAYSKECNICFDTIFLKAGKLEYHFCNKDVEINNWRDLTKYDFYDHPIPIIHGGEDIFSLFKTYQSSYNKLASLRKEYRHMCYKKHSENNPFRESVNKYVNEYLHELDVKESFLEEVEKYGFVMCKSDELVCVDNNQAKKASPGEKKVMEILCYIATKCKLAWFHRFRWSFCKNLKSLEYDFFCVLFHRNRLFYFVKIGRAHV